MLSELIEEKGFLYIPAKNWHLDLVSHFIIRTVSNILDDFRLLILRFSMLSSERATHPFSKPINMVCSLKPKQILVAK